MNEPIIESIERLDSWVGNSHWLSYDPFDGLSAPLARKLTFEIPLLRIALLQTVRRLPINIRPLLGITKKRSNQAMGYFASGYLRLFKTTGQQEYLDKAIFCLNNLQENSSPGYHGYAWGWCFDYQSRGHFLTKGIPSVVWTSFVTYSFLDAYETLGEQKYLDVARKVCEFILYDLPRHQISPDAGCISYVPDKMLEIHNANMLAASILARVYKHTREPALLAVASQAVRYTMNHQHPDGSWYYGEGMRWRWIDGYHTGFVLDSLYWYIQSTGDETFLEQLVRGMDYYRKNLFQGAVPKHYDYSAFPIDIQSASQAIQTFAFIPEKFHGDLSWAEEVARWAIKNMQDLSGYFYFRRNRRTLDKTPFLHWGQATMLAALALVLQNRQTKSSWDLNIELKKELT
jgi:rhamnogalacturonyl hydrolase YesR